MRLAFTVSVSLLLMLPARTENDALADPPLTVIEAGTVRGAFSLKLISTSDPLLGAAADRLTLQVADVFEASAVGLQANLVTNGSDGGANSRETLFDEPARDAANLALVADVTLEAVA